MKILLSDLKLVLPDLLEKKRPLFEATNTGKTYLPLLQAQLDTIDALPPGPAPGTPLADELAERDDDHDGYGGAAWHLLEAYTRCPATDGKLRAAAGRIRARFIPALAELQQTYAAEADKARDRKAVLDEYKTDLQLFPVAENKTLLDWVESYLEAGISLSAMLSDRADTSLDSRAGAAPLRTRTLGILSRMRGALSDEVAADTSLPRDLEAQVFAFFDQRVAEARASKKHG